MAVSLEAETHIVGMHSKTRSGKCTLHVERYLVNLFLNIAIQVGVEFPVRERRPDQTTVDTTNRFDLYVLRLR